MRRSIASYPATFHEESCGVFRCCVEMCSCASVAVRQSPLCLWLLACGHGFRLMSVSGRVNVQSMAEAEFKSRRSAELQSQIQTRLMGLSMGLGTVPNMSLRAMQQQPAFGGMGVVGALPTEPSQAAFYVSGQQSATT